jgi:site-specific DNA recombinase
VPIKKVRQTKESINDNNAVIYLRVSTKTQLEGHGIDAQLSECNSFAEKNNYNVIAIKEDLAISGAKGLTVRKGLDEAINLCLTGKASILLCSALDRQSRDVGLFRDIRTQLQEHGIKFITAKEGRNFSSKSNQFMGNIYAAFAEEEREKIAWRLRNGRREKSLIDGRGSGQPTYGYKTHYIDEKTKEIIINEKEAKLVRLVLSKIDEGMSYSAVARHLTKQGIKTPRGLDTWSYMSVRHFDRHRELYTTGKKQWSYLNTTEEDMSEYDEIVTVRSKKLWPIIYKPAKDK